MECAICLENIDISKNNIIELDCCKQTIHISCIKAWINKNNNPTCPICRNESDFLLDLKFSNINEILNTNRFEINIIEDYQEVSESTFKSCLFKCLRCTCIIFTWITIITIIVVLI